MLSAARYFRPGAQPRSRATSSGLSTTGSRSGDGTVASRSPKPPRPSVTLKKKRNVETAAFILAGEAPCAAMCSRKRRRSSGFGLIGRLAEEGREGPDGPDGVGLRFGAEMPDGHVVDHARAQWADGFVAHGGSCPRRGDPRSSDKPRRADHLTCNTSHLYRESGLVL